MPRLLTLRRALATHAHAVVFCGTVGQILLQFLLSMQLMRLFGATGNMDAYRAALTLPTLVSAVLSGTFAPLLITTLGRQSSGEANKGLAGRLIVCLSGISLLLAILGTVFRTWILGQFVPDFTPAQFDLTSNLLLVLVWLIPANLLIGLFQGVLNASLAFATPALAGVLGPAVTIAVVLVTGRTHGVMAIAWGTLAGALANVLVQAPRALKRVTFGRRNWEEGALFALFRMALPILTGMLVLKWDPVVDRHLASAFEKGSITRLDVATGVVSLFLMLASGTLSTIAFPRISRMIGGDESGLAREIRNALRVLLILCLPALAALLCFARPLVRDLFERGEFLPSDTAIVARMVQIASPMLIAASLGELSTKALYALRDTLSPTLVSISLLICGIIAKLLIVPQGGIYWLPALTAAVYVISASLQLLLVRRRVKGPMLSGLPLQTFQCLLATGVALGIGGVMQWLQVPWSGVVGLLAGAVGYFATLWGISPGGWQHLFGTGPIEDEAPQA